MKHLVAAGACGIVLGLPACAVAAPIPDAIRALILKASDSNDSAQLAAAAALAKRTYPQSSKEIDSLVSKLMADADARHQAELAHRGFFEGWKGQGQLGGSNSTGNTRSLGLSAALNMNRDGINWQHQIVATADYGRDNGIEDKDRLFASYQANYKFTGRLYALGLASWESDLFSGFDSRISESLGLGYRVVQLPNATFSLEAGPALRQTNYILGASENEFAGRVAGNYMWKILPNLTFTEIASVYTESRDSTFTSDTALNVQLIGALSAQLSYHVQYETHPVLALDNTDTISRVTLVYSF